MLKHRLLVEQMDPRTYDGLLSVYVYQIHSHGFGRPEAILEDTCPICYAVGLNLEPCG
uniref:Uncharacterized protein n=1 Tax=Octopus bimaculoides TaxID=37653 RepID=A0A0L8HNW7_OCTBM